MSENETMARAESTEGSSVATERQSTTKVIRAAIVGTVVEYYDFGIYGYMATTIAALFFVSHDPNPATLGTFAAFAIAFLPTVPVPVIDGSFVLVGLPVITRFVGFEVACADPSRFVATTCERILNPASEGRSTYVSFAALEIRRQFEASGAPGPSQRNQRNAYWIGSVPVQLPRVVLRI